MRLRIIPSWKIFGILLFVGWLGLTAYQVIRIAHVSSWTCSYAIAVKWHKPHIKGSPGPERSMASC